MAQSFCLTQCEFCSTTPQEPAYREAELNILDFLHFLKLVYIHAAAFSSCVVFATILTNVQHFCHKKQRKTVVMDIARWFFFNALKATLKEVCSEQVVFLYFKATQLKLKKKNVDLELKQKQTINRKIS